MEIIKITEHQHLIINEDNITYVRTDVFSEEFKNRVFLFSDLKRVVYQSQGINWLSSIIGSGIVAILTLGHDGVIAGENAKIKLIFKKSSRDIDMEDLSAKEIKIIVSKINSAIKKWHSR
jgi:hypothetical protein